MKRHSFKCQLCDFQIESILEAYVKNIEQCPRCGALPWMEAKRIQIIDPSAPVQLHLERALANPITTEGNPNDGGSS